MKHFRDFYISENSDYSFLFNARAKKYENPNPTHATTTISAMKIPMIRTILLNTLQSVTSKRLYT